LAEIGWEAQSLTMTLCEREEEYVRQKLDEEQIRLSQIERNICCYNDKCVQHIIYYTNSTWQKKMTQEEATEFYNYANRILKEWTPDVIITYGRDNLNHNLIAIAKSKCQSLVNYHDDISYDNIKYFRQFDNIIMPTNFIASYYRQQLGVEGKVLKTPISTERQISSSEVLGIRKLDARKHGLITCMNPLLSKGGGLFARIVQIAARERPDLLFLGVGESITDENWAKIGVDLGKKHNLCWMSNHKNLRLIYTRTSILLFPSFISEPAGHYIAEAQLAGIPVLAANNGSLPEQLNGGGVLIDIPKRCQKNYYEIPNEDEVRPWLDMIYKLMDDDEAFFEATILAKKSAIYFLAYDLKEEIVNFFENLYKKDKKRSSLDLKSNLFHDQNSSDIVEDYQKSKSKNKIKTTNNLREIFKHRYKTSKERVLPNFLIIGAQKSGTTSLFTYLSQHNQILPSLVKEVHYFDGGLDTDVDNFKKGEDWYRAFFPLKHEMSENAQTFEASPLYIFNPLTPARIYNLIPNIKLILLLRNPVHRAISQYFHEKSKGHEHLGIMDALYYEDERLNEAYDKQNYKNYHFIHHSYKSRGLYVNQLKRYLNYFNKEQIFIINSDDFFSQTHSTLEKLFDYIGVNKDKNIMNLNPKNVSAKNKNVDEEVYDYLYDYFYKPNSELYDLIGRDLGWNQ
jgi:glycosyltransferase involved in cell wall biosynthesis